MQISKRWYSLLEIQSHNRNLNNFLLILPNFLSFCLGSTAMQFVPVTLSLECVSELWNVAGCVGEGRGNPRNLPQADQNTLRNMNYL